MVLLNNRYKEDLIHYFNFVYRQSENAVPQPITRGALYRYFKASLPTKSQHPVSPSRFLSGILKRRSSSRRRVRGRFSLRFLIKPPITSSTLKPLFSVYILTNKTVYVKNFSAQKLGIRAVVRHGNQYFTRRFFVYELGSNHLVFFIKTGECLIENINIGCNR